MRISTHYEWRGERPTGGHDKRFYLLDCHVLLEMIFLNDNQLLSFRALAVHTHTPYQSYRANVVVVPLLEFPMLPRR